MTSFCSRSSLVRSAPGCSDCKRACGLHESDLSVSMYVTTSAQVSVRCMYAYSIHNKCFKHRLANYV